MKIRYEGIVSFGTTAAKALREIAPTSYTYLVYERSTGGQYTQSAGSLRNSYLVKSASELEQLAASTNIHMDSLETEYFESLLSPSTWLMIMAEGDQVAHWSWISFDRSSAVDDISSLHDYSSGPYIGNCFTKPAFRGNGYYPTALRAICQALGASPYSKIRLTVSPENRSSIRGVEKAGFEFIGQGVLTISLVKRLWQT